MNVKLSVWEKIGFSLGDMGGNFVYQSVVLLLAYYYTDVFGISAATVATIFFFVRLLDAITDPAMGMIVDRTNSRWGKYRPYLLFLCVPYALASILAFVVPDTSTQGKILYAYVTYGLLMLLFTATNIPYFALGSVMTSDVEERISLNSYRFVAATVGGLAVTALLIPLAEFLGQGDKASGYQQAMAIMAGFSVVLFIICFLSTRERVKPVDFGNRGIIKDVKQVLTNDQWMILGAVVLTMVTAQTIKATMAVYYVTYYVGSDGAMLPLFLSLWMFGGIFGSGMAALLTKYICKKKSWIMLLVISSGLSLGTYFISPEHIFSIMLMQLFVGFFNQMMAPLIFSAMADVTDYGEIKFKRRLDGLIASFTLFSLKLGLAFGGSIATYLLATYGYESGGVEQSEVAISGILKIFTLAPAVGFAIAALILSKMKLNSLVVHENARFLAQLRAVK